MPVSGKRNLIIGATAAIAMVVLAFIGVLIGGQLGKKSGTTNAATQSTTPAAAPVTSTRAAAPTTAAPSAGASLPTVLAWIRAGTPADASNFHTATDTNGAQSDLDVGLAFVSPTKKIQCMTPKKSATSYMHGLTCLVNFDDPQPRPAALPHGEWVASWVDYPGSNAGIGTVASDPGQFSLGYGGTLSYGSKLTFDDYECRMDQTGLLCADQSAGTALQLSSAGPVPFGCFTKTDGTAYAITYGCGGSDESATTITTSTPR